VLLKVQLRVRLSLGNRSRRGFRRAHYEVRKVTPLGNDDDHRLAAALVGKVMFQLEPKKSSLRANDVVVAGIVAGHPPENMDAHLLLRSGSRLVFHCTSQYVKQEFAKFGRSLECDTTAHPADQFRPWVGAPGERMYRTRYWTSASFHKAFDLHQKTLVLGGPTL